MKHVTLRVRNIALQMFFRIFVMDNQLARTYFGRFMNTLLARVGMRLHYIYTLVYNIIYMMHVFV